MKSEQEKRNEERDLNLQEDFEKRKDIIDKVHLQKDNAQNEMVRY